MTHRMPFMPDPRAGQRGNWTMYRGLVYQSHLEAAFAETLDHATPGPWSHEYHPIVQGTTYPPDFLVEDNTYVELKTALFDPEANQPTLWDHESQLLDEGQWRRNVEHQMERMETLWTEQPDAILVLIEQRPAGPIPSAEALLIGMPGWKDHPKGWPDHPPEWFWAHMLEGRPGRLELLGPWDFRDYQTRHPGSGPREAGFSIEYLSGRVETSWSEDYQRRELWRAFAASLSGAKPFWPLPWRDRGPIAALGYRIH